VVLKRYGRLIAEFALMANSFSQTGLQQFAALPAPVAVATL
jgi:hypothetical protein